MGEGNDTGPGLTSFPAIPQAGLAAVLASWVGRGSLFEALSVPSNDQETRQWTSADTRMRANRVLLSLLEPTLERWPKRASEWLDYLPAAKIHARAVEHAPFPGVAWAESRRRFGWPPIAFTGKVTERSADMLALQILRWCVERLAQIWKDNVTVQPDIRFRSEIQLTAALKLLELQPLASASPMTPARVDLVALRREGAPWGSVANVAQIILQADTSLDYLLYQVLMPDDEIRWRLFHLAVLGVLLTSLGDADCQITSLRPISPKSSGPNYEVVTAEGEHCLLWFEASSVWSYLDKKSPFVEATSGLRRAHRNNGADVLLLIPNSRALILECKYSSSQDFVAREGYYQAMAYCAEIHEYAAEYVLSVAVGPESVVSESSFTSLSIGRVGSVPPSALPSLVNEFMSI
jgi:hypothetical protein